MGIRNLIIIMGVLQTSDFLLLLLLLAFVLVFVISLGILNLTILGVLLTSALQGACKKVLFVGVSRSWLTLLRLQLGRQPWHRLLLGPQLPPLRLHRLRTGLRLQPPRHRRQQQLGQQLWPSRHHRQQLGQQMRPPRHL